MATFLRIKIDEMESKKLIEEHEGGNITDYLIQVIEKAIVNSYDDGKLDEYDVNVRKKY